MQPNGGNVGINAINPDDGDLQIGDANSAFTIAVAGARTKFGYDGTNAIVQGGLAKGIAFCVNNATLGSGEAMRISSGGNVGIGTSSPASLVSGGSSPVLSIGGTDAVLTTGDKSGSVSFVTNDPSFISTYSDGITGEIASVAESSVGGAYGLAFYTGTTGSAGRNERVRITSAGLVGIGTSSPSYALDVVSSATNNEPLARFSSAGGVRALFNTDSDDDGSLSLYDKSNVAKVLIRSLGDSYLNGGNVYMAATNAGVTSGGFAFVTGSVDYQMIGHATGTPTGNYYIGFRYGSNTIGTITQQGTTGISYNTSSDQRLKENIADADDAGSKIDAIQVRKYDWKADGSHQDYGMIAQELQLVAPEAVSAPEDPEEMMGVDYSKLVPMLIKEIQSLRNRVAQLEE